MAAHALPSLAHRTLLCVVDESEEMHVALTFAALRSLRTGCHVGLLHVIDTPADFQHWAMVGDLMRQEAREHAEGLLLRAAEIVMGHGAGLPSLDVREGDRVEETVAACEENSSVAFLILASDTGPKGPGPLVSSFTGKSVGRLNVPVVILPGGLSEEETARFA